MDVNLEKSRHKIGACALAAVMSITLLVTPFNSIDPINLPKLCLLIITSFTLFGLILGNLANFFTHKSKHFVYLVAGFILQLILVFTVDNRSFSLKFYGTSSRNTGFIAYLCLSFLLLAITSITEDYLVKIFIWGFIISGLIIGVYGIAQSVGLDFFKYNLVYSSKVFGTFGNPNFQSAFMGMVAAASLTLLIFGKFKFLRRSILGLIVILCLYNISVSSQQGYLDFVAGVSIAGIIYLLKRDARFLAGSFLGIFCGSVLLVLLGILDKGPLASIVYKSSLQFRGFYWRGAVRMISQHPIFGIGMDGYGDWYRRSRSAKAANINAGVVSDTAHNIPLDIGASGGLPLLILYLTIIGYAIYAIIKVLKRKSEFDVYFVAIVAAWVAYQAQSLISINQLGLGVWGWSLTGLLIGYEINTRNAAPAEIQKLGRSGKVAAEKLSAGALVITFLTGAIGLGIALPPYLAANKFYKALQSGDANVIQPAAYLQPYDRSRFLYVAQILSSNKLEPQAIKVLRDAAKIYPDSFEVWQQWSALASASPADVAHAKAEMKRLDPYNPGLK